MDYTKEDGQYYKVLRQNGEIQTFGELLEGQVLSTIKTVVFITKEEKEALDAAKALEEEAQQQGLPSA